MLILICHGLKSLAGGRGWPAASSMQGGCNGGTMGRKFADVSCKNSECDLSRSGFSYSSNHRGNRALPTTITDNPPLQGAKIIKGVAIIRSDFHQGYGIHHGEHGEHGERNRGIHIPLLLAP